MFRSIVSLKVISNLVPPFLCYISLFFANRWLSGPHVELPQYAEQFRRHGVNGSRLPQVAVSTGYLAKVVGVTNAIHRSKITLKAMDVVLFGPPKSDSSPLKDLILTSLLLAAITGLLYAYRQNRKSQLHLQKVCKVSIKKTCL